MGSPCVLDVVAGALPVPDFTVFLHARDRLALRPAEDLEAEGVEGRDLDARDPGALKALGEGLLDRLVEHDHADPRDVGLRDQAGDAADQGGRLAGAGGRVDEGVGAERVADDRGLFGGPGGHDDRRESSLGGALAG